MADHRVCIQDGQLTLVVDAELGGHIVEFSLCGENALAVARPEIGSTFWPSPQHSWGWPPPKALDKASYSFEKSEQRIDLVSSVCELTGLQVRKTFSLMPAYMLAEYRMVNRRDEPCSYAPWEITRIPGGLTFYKSSEAPLSISTGVAELERGVVWHDYRPAMQEHNEKIYGNRSAGWIANIHNGLLLIKEFAPVATADLAPSEAEVEIYSHGDPQNPYIEMEQQGAYQSIPAGGELYWAVKWYLRRLPKRIEVCVGNPQLLELVESVLADTTEDSTA